MILVHLITLLILFKTGLCTQYIDPQSKVLTDPKLLMKISTYLDNPYRNLALVGRNQWKLLRAITPGRILADRLGFPEVGSVDDFNSDTKLFFELDRRNFYSHFVALFVVPINEVTLTAGSTKKILIQGMFHYLMGSQVDEVRQFYSVIREIVFKELMNYWELRSAYNLLDRFDDFVVSEQIIDEDQIIPLLKQAPSFTMKNFYKFNSAHFPAIFSYIINSNLKFSELKEALLSLPLPSPRLNDHISQKIFNNFEFFLRTTNLPSCPESLILVDFIIDRMRDFCHKNYINISFYRDMSILRFELQDTIKHENIIYKWLHSNTSHFETILCILLRIDSLILSLNLIKHCKLVIKFNPQLKDTFREHPKLLNYFDFDTVLYLHANNYNETFQTYLKIAAPMVLFRILEASDYLGKQQMIQKFLNIDNLRQTDFTFEQYLSILRYLASREVNSSFEMRFSLLEALMTILSEFPANVSNGMPPVIHLRTDFFIDLLQSQYNGQISTFNALRTVKRFGHFWRIEPSALQHIFKPENEHLFQLLLNNNDVLSLLAVNLLELILLSDFNTWTDKVCPLFQINHQTQFFRIDGRFWPDLVNQLEEIDSVINGDRPVVPYVTSPSAWSILPRLTLRSFVQYPQNCDLLRLWARYCMVTLVIYAPKQQILRIINRTAVVMKWIEKRPNDLEFNIRFAEVFLDEHFENEFECSSFDELKYYKTKVSPFLMPLKPYIKAPMRLNIRWKRVISTIANVDQFRELIQLTSVHQVITAFEASPELKEQCSVYYELLYDFDFLFE